LETSAVALCRRLKQRGWRLITVAALMYVGLSAAMAAAGQRPAAAPPPPMIGAQISRLQAVTEHERRRFFAELRHSGFNTVIVRVFQNRGDRFHRLAAGSRPGVDAGVYFRTDHAPMVADWLPGVCHAAHAEGLKIFAWMTTLTAVYGILPPAPLVWAYDPDTGLCVSRARFDPARPETRAHLTALYRDLAAQPIDGILFQDDLMLHHTEGFRLVGGHPEPDPARLYRSERKTGSQTRIIGYHAAFRPWTEQRAQMIESLANALMATCRSVNPALVCARNLHYETLLNPAWGRAWFAESPTALATSTADYFLVMAYQEQIRQELELKTEAQLEATMARLIAAGNHAPWCRNRVIFKFQAVCWQSERPARREWIARLLEMLKSANQSAVVLAPYNRNHFARLLSIFAAGGCMPRPAALNHGRPAAPLAGQTSRQAPAHSDGQRI
jgi:biofilm PGA synthesis lipoprotein PgaB